MGRLCLGDPLRSHYSGSTEIGVALGLTDFGPLKVIPPQEPRLRADRHAEEVKTRPHHP